MVDDVVLYLMDHKLRVPSTQAICDTSVRFHSADIPRFQDLLLIECELLVLSPHAEESFFSLTWHLKYLLVLSCFPVFFKIIQFSYIFAYRLYMFYDFYILTYLCYGSSYNASQNKHLKILKFCSYSLVYKYSLDYNPFLK